MKARLTALWHRICWNAWNYARNREMVRRGSEFGIAPVPDSRDDQSPGHRRVIANEARQLLENRHFREAFAAVDDKLEAQAGACDPDNKDMAQRVVIAKQLMTAIKREIVRKVEDGYMAEVELNEIERKRRPVRLQR